jgi:ribA/ribD-fused uncharacterized protein
MNRVVHCKKDKYDIYIGRRNKDLPESKWKNPFVVDLHGDRDYCILKYELYLNTRPDLLLSLEELKGKILGCWCHPKYCHGDILVKLSESKYIQNWFSNMRSLENPIIYQGVEYKAVENFYQAMKLPKDRIDLREQIAKLNPFSSKTEIRNKNKYTWRDDWTKEESIKVMEYALEKKFLNNKTWKDKLLMTENWPIVEWNNWGDKFWGKDIRTNEGENNLGLLLMKIRRKINE